MYSPSKSMRGEWSKGGAVRRLSAAILLLAIEDLYGRSVRRRWDAICWLRSKRGSEFSFIFCCMILGLHAGRVRSILERHYIAGAYALTSKEVHAGLLMPLERVPRTVSSRRERQVEWALLSLMSAQS